MDKYLPARFHALGDPTRLAIIDALLAGPASVSSLAAPHSMALPAFMKHIAVLERAGLISSAKPGRTRICRIESQAIADIETWLGDRHQLWQRRFERLDALVSDERPSSKDKSP